MFGLLAVCLSFFWFVNSGVNHASSGWISFWASFPAPRFLMSQVGMFLLLVFLFGVIFLAFDIRARDRRERMLEVLDSRPLCNVELLFGRVLGVSNRSTGDLVLADAIRWRPAAHLASHTE